MGQQTILIGNSANDGTGDPARTAFDKVNDNFDEIYAKESRTINAGAVDYTGLATVELRIQAAIDDAVAGGDERVFVPANMLPYNPSLVTFNTGVQMVREGGAFNVYDVLAYGAVGDGTTDDTTAFNAAVTAAAAGNGVVVVPGVSSSYLIAGTILLQQGVTIQGLNGIYGVRLFSQTVGQTVLQFVGTSEGEGMNLALRDLEIQGPTSSGCGIRLRNFANIHISGCAINHFAQGIWADWGFGLFLTQSQIVFNDRGVQLGGDLAGGTPTPGAGIRGGPGTPWLDQVTITDTGFSQNQIDINDMGSSVSLGVLKVAGCSFFEGSPVASKTKFVSVVARKGYQFSANWFESQNAARTMLHISNVDYDSNTRQGSYGGHVVGNDFLYNDTTATSIGVEVVSGRVLIEGNCFEFGAGATPVKLTDATNASEVGLNTWLAYADNPVFAGPIMLPAGAGGAGGHHLSGAKAPQFVTLSYGANVDTDPAVASVYQIIVTDTNAFTIRSPSSQGLNTIVAGRAGTLTYEIHNGSGGVMGTITWGAAFMLGGAFTNPANGKKRMITFFWNGVGAQWVELSRSAADVG